MATNGRMQAGSVTIGGNGGNYYFIDWQLAGQNISNNNSTINWQAYFHYNNADAQLDNGIANLSGTRWNNGGRVRNYGGTFTTRNVAIASGSFVIGHAGDGTQSISVSGGVNVYGSGRSEGATSFSLPTIPRNSQVTTNDSGNYTLGTPLTIYTNRKAGFTHLIRIRQANSGGTIIQEVNNITDSYTWTPSPTQITDMQAMIPNANSLVLYIEQYNNQVGQWSNISVTTYLTDANPTYSDFTFKDSASAVTTITGNNQVLVKGKSTLEVIISAANKMVANKSATSDKYALTYDGTTLQTPYKASGDVVQTFTNIDTVGSRAIQVGAYDSRGNNTTVAKNVVVYDYTAPVIEAEITRAGNFSANVTIKTSGTFDLLPIGGSNKNALTTSTLQYRYREIGAGTWGSWVTIGFTTSTNTFLGTDKFVTLDNTKEFEFEIHVTDKFGTVTQTATLSTGKPVMFVGRNSSTPAVGIGKLPENGMLDVDGDIYSNGKKVPVLDAGSKILASSMPAGSTIQVVQGTNSSNTSSSSSTYIDTALSKSITPSSSSNKIKITISQPYYASDINGTGLAFRIMRGGTAIVDPAIFYAGYENASQGMRSMFSYTYIDSPSTTTSTTYKTQFKRAVGTGTVTVNDTGAISTIILEEIVG